MIDVICPRCGHPNQTGSNFCSSCGAPVGTGEEHTVGLPAIDADSPPAPPSGAQEGPTVTLDELAPGMGMLLVQRGPGAGSRFVLEDDVVAIGRHPDSEIFLDDVTVSRRHAQVVHTGDEYHVCDVGSLNGTYLNRERIDNDTELNSGDELQVGRFKLLFVVGSA